MDLTIIFILAGVIIFLGFFGEIIFRKTKIPDALLLLAFGMLLSRYFSQINLGGYNDIIIIFTTFAMVFLGFEGAVNLNIERLIKGFGKGALLTFANFFISVIIVTLIAKIAGLSWLSSLILGIILGAISSEIVIPMLKSLGLREASVMSLTIESALGDVLCILSLIIAIKFAKVGEITWSVVANTIFVYFLVSIIIGLILGLLWIFFLKSTEHVSKSYMITIAFVALIYGAVTYFKYDGAFACLAFGLVLGNSETFLKVLRKQQYAFTINPHQKFFFSQISFFVKTFFFVYLGLLMVFANTRLVLIGVIITIALFLARPIAVYIAFRKDAVSKDRALMETIVPRGLAAAVLAQIPMQSGIKGTESFSVIVLIVVLLSIAIATFLVFLIRHGWFKGFGKVYANIYTTEAKKVKKGLEKRAKKIEKEKGT